MGSGYEQSMSTDPEFKKRLASLCGLMSDKLGIKKLPKIVLTQNQENADKPFGNTAYYNPPEQYIKIFITDRHPTDVLRSFAHELIHHWQNEHGALPPQKSHEHYAQVDPVLRKREMEAYLMGNILFRDWQDEQRYGKINESLSIKDPNKVTKTFRNILFALIRDGAIGAYAETSKELDPNDFVDELSRKLELEIDKFLQLVNNRGNWEPGRNTITEDMTKEQLKELIRSRILESSWASKEGGEAWAELKDEARKRKKKRQRIKWKAMRKTGENDDSTFPWDRWREQRQKDFARAAPYYEIGFDKPEEGHYCWYWDLKNQKIVMAQGFGHKDHFGEVPYHTFRGRYDIKKGRLSITIAAFGGLAIQSYSGDYKKDIPPKLQAAIKKTFNNPKISYFPFSV